MITIPTLEMNVSDEEVFAAFDLARPELKSVKTALALGDLSLAKKELVHYFQTRTNVTFYYDYRNLPLTPIETDSNPYLFQASLGLRGSLKEFCLFAGNKMMEHIYVRPGAERLEVNLGQDYENLPHFNYYEDQGKKHRTILDIFVRGQFFEYLAILYHETGDSKVLEQFEETLQMFWENYSLTIENTDPALAHFSFTEERDAMSVGFLSLCYLSLFYTRIPYEISTEMAFGIIKRIWFIGLQFRRFDNDTYRKYNHHMWERGLVPYMLATLLPEIPAFTSMKTTGAQVVRQHIYDDFNEAGGYDEHSIPYWSGAALGEMIGQGIHLARLNNATLLDEETQKRIDTSYDVLAQIAPPTSCFPSLGDGGGPLVLPVLTNGALRAGNHFCKELKDYRLGVTTTVPAIPLDYCNDQSGFFSTKSSHEADANYALMSAKVACGDTGHNHMDMLSLFVTMGGQEMIGEPHARDLYHHAAIGDPLRGYNYNMEAHNTVLAYGGAVQDDEFYCYKWGVLRPDSPVETFVTEERGCFVSAYHDAYTFCRHTRKILSCREKGFLVHDCLLGGDRLPRPHIQRWHLFPDVTYRQVDERSILLEKNGVRTLLLWDGTPELCIWHKEGVPGSTIIDARFTPVISAVSDIGPVSQNLLILDVSAGVPAIKNPDQLCAALLSDAENGKLSDALDTFSQIL